MKAKKFIMAAIAAALWVSSARAAAKVVAPEAGFFAAFSDADQEVDRFIKAKEFVFKMDWPQARKRLEQFLKDYPKGRLRDEALFWLAKSLNGLAGREKSAPEAAALKKEAFANLERLVREHPESSWKDDAERLRIEIAGELVLLGIKDYEGFIREYAASRSKDETALKLSALDSLIRLEPETALKALVSGLEAEPDPRVRKKCATLLGRNYDEESLPALEKASRSDRDENVRTEAGYWASQVRMRLIPAEMSYYLLAARVTGDAARSRIKEKALNFFTTSGKAAGMSGARRIISGFFENQVGGFESAAWSERAANAFMSMSGSQTSHRIHDFQVSIVPGSIRKSPGQVEGEILFVDRVSGARLTETFSVDGQNGQIVAARRGDKAAVMLVQFEPAVGGPPAEREDEVDSSTGGLARLMSKLFGGRSDREPVYYTLYANYLGCRVHTTLQSSSPGDSMTNIQDFSLAKAEIPAKGESKGVWILTGHILGFNKERSFKARQASLVDPSGKVVAVADEITVAVDDPAAFRVQGSRLQDQGVVETVKKMKIAAPPATPESKTEGPILPQTCELENGVKVFYSAAKSIGDAELSGPLVEFGKARVEMPAAEGTWRLEGFVRLITSGNLFLCEQATLTDPQGRARTKDARVLVPMKTPAQYTILERRPEGVADRDDH